MSDLKIDHIYFGECLEVMEYFPSARFDLILSDLPYGTTKNKWDSIIPLDELWSLYKRLIKPNGAIVLTAAQPFTSMLVASNLSMFKYEWIWSKTIGSGQLNIKHQPLRTHESVLVFYNKIPTYNPQFTEGSPYKFTRKSDYDGPSYNKQREVEVENSGFRYPKSVLSIPNPRIKGGHPTQKPVELFEYMIKTYTNVGDLVLDNCIGSGTTAVSALSTSRHYVGIENDERYYKMTLERIRKYKDEHS